MPEPTIEERVERLEKLLATAIRLAQETSLGRMFLKKLGL